MILIENLIKYYNDIQALKGISFEVKEGEIVGILGPNGAGKSTTLRIITSYVTASAGNVIIDGKNINEHARAVKRIIGYLPESAPLYNDMIVYDYLMYNASIQEVPEDKKEERLVYVVNACNLRDVVHKPIGTLSKGYKQRVGLAGAIIHDPKILILDEPTNGLDPNQIVEIRELIKTLGREKTVLISTHILSEVQASCSRVIIINNGEVIADSPTEKLIERKGIGLKVKITLNTNLSTSELINNINSLEAIASVDIIEDNGNIKVLTISTKDKEDSVKINIYKAIKNIDAVIYELVYEKEDLEHVFMELTKGDK